MPETRLINDGTSATRRLGRQLSDHKAKGALMIDNIQTEIDHIFTEIDTALAEIENILTKIEAMELSREKDELNHYTRGKLLLLVNNDTYAKIALNAMRATKRGKTPNV
jgi:hypothetical protein